MSAIQHRLRTLAAQRISTLERENDPSGIKAILNNSAEKTKRIEENRIRDAEVKRKSGWGRSPEEQAVIRAFMRRD